MSHIGASGALLSKDLVQARCPDFAAQLKGL